MAPSITYLFLLNTYTVHLEKLHTVYLTFANDIFSEKLCLEKEFLMFGYDIYHVITGHTFCRVSLQKVQIIGTLCPF